MNCTWRWTEKKSMLQYISLRTALSCLIAVAPRALEIGLNCRSLRFKTDPTHTAFAPSQNLGHAEKVTHAYLPLGLKIMPALLITWPKCDYKWGKEIENIWKGEKSYWRAVRVTPSNPEKQEEQEEATTRSARESPPWLLRATNSRMYQPKWKTCSIQYGVYRSQLDEISLLVDSEIWISLTFRDKKQIKCNAKTCKKKNVIMSERKGLLWKNAKKACSIVYVVKNRRWGLRRVLFESIGN